MQSHGSFYGGDLENNLDFYILIFRDIESQTPTFVSQLFGQSYTINTPKPHDMRYSVVNWYSGLVINDCTLTPTFLRLSGFMTAADEKNGTSRLALFFDNLVFFSASTDPSNFEVNR